MNTRPEEETTLTTAPAGHAGRHRPELLPLIGQRVTVTSGTGATWSGKLAGLMDRPTLVLQLDTGRTVCLSQDHEVTAAAPSAADRVQALLPAVDAAEAAVRAMGATSEDAGPLRRLAELRSQMQQIAGESG